MTLRPGKTMLMLGVSLCCTLPAASQRTTPQPVTDAAAQASPVRPPTPAPVIDSASEASPITGALAHGTYIPAHTPVSVQLAENIDSGNLKNGQTVSAKLTSPVKTAAGRMLPAGTPAVLTVIATAPAGRISAVGELSLQLVRVGQAAVDTEIQTFRGQPGHRDLPDSAPAVGTNAGLASGTALTFHVQPLPGPVQGPPPQRASTPGSVTRTASGSQAAPGANGGGANASSNPGANGTGNIPSGRTVPSITPNTNTMGPAENIGQPSVAPNQPASPAQPNGAIRQQR